MTAATMAERLLDAMADAAARQYGGEPVSELAHGLPAAHPRLPDALALRRWEDRAKVPGAATRPLGAWARRLRAHAMRPRDAG